MAFGKIEEVKTELCDYFLAVIRLILFLNNLVCAILFAPFIWSEYRYIYFLDISSSSVFYEYIEIRLNTDALEASFMESLILAQDECWRRA